MRTNVARKVQHEEKAEKPVKGLPSGGEVQPLLATVEVRFDEETFMQEEYEVAENDTLRFVNQSTSSTLTVYVLTEDGQDPSTQLLGQSTSQVSVGSQSYVDKTVDGTGKFLLSLDPAPQDPPEGNELSGSRVVIIVSG